MIPQRQKFIANMKMKYTRGSRHHWSETHWPPLLEVRGKGVRHPGGGSSAMARWNMAF